MGAVNTLAAFLREWVTPTLAEAGFSKRGRIYRMQSGDGGLAFVEARLYRLFEDFVSFHVDTAVSPAALVEWGLKDLPADERRPENGRWGHWEVRLDPNQLTVAAARSQLLEGRRELLNFHPPWIFPKTGDVSVCGRDLREQLQRAVPAMLQLLDPQAMLARLRAAPELKGVNLQINPRWAEAVLLSGYGESAELQELLTDIDARSPGNPLTPWVRSRVHSPMGPKT